MEKLKKELLKIDGGSYKAYKGLKGRYDFKNFVMELVHIQGDPFAAPSLIKVEINLDRYMYDKELYNNISRKTAFEDYIGRVFSTEIKKNVKGRRGSGKSGNISIYKSGQEILKRSNAEIKNNVLAVKFYAGLPAAGRRVLSKEAIKMFFDEIPLLVKKMETDNIDVQRLKNHIDTNETADMIREQLKSKGLCSFVVNGAMLPRRSGVDDRPLLDGIKFYSPKSMEVSLELPNGKKLTGMGIKKGITIITGGGFHGKSTLLSAIEKGVYNHIPFDGREYVITDYDAVKIRAEDGRGINNVDISPFINNLPYNKDTKEFFTENASGSTSQAANVIEALEIGSDLLLIDEDTSATNFMMRDIKIQQVVKKEKEPITPFIERIRSMYEKMGISAIIVVGGLGDYFDVADTVLMLDEYVVEDITEKAKSAVQKYMEYNREKEIFDDKFAINQRKIDPNSYNLLFSAKDKVKSRDTDEIRIGYNEIDLRNVEQLVETGQTSFIGESIKNILKKISKENNNLNVNLKKYEEILKTKNISDVLGSESGNLVYARRYEVAAAINRIREKIID